MTSQYDKEREAVKKRIADANHLSKPDAKNAMVVRDAEGNWLFEIYYPEGHPFSIGR
jgi:hypothetical protein